jgi:hypothetical protein
MVRWTDELLQLCESVGGTSVMDSKLVSSAVECPAEVVRSEQTSNAEMKVLAEVRQAIVADCRMNPEKYLEGIGLAASGE